MVPTKNFKFFVDADAAAVSGAMDVPYAGRFVVAVSGTFEGEIEIQGGKDEAWHPMSAIALASLTGVSSITEEGLYLVVGADGVDEIRAEIKSISSGEVTVSGKFAFC